MHMYTHTASNTGLRNLTHIARTSWQPGHQTESHSGYILFPFAPPHPSLCPLSILGLILDPAFRVSVHHLIKKVDS